MTFDPKKTRPFLLPHQRGPMVVILRSEFDQPVTGGWCETCLLPSIVTVRFRVVTMGGTRVGGGEAWHCDGCGASG